MNGSGEAFGICAAKGERANHVSGHYAADEYCILIHRANQPPPRGGWGRGRGGGTSGNRHPDPDPGRKQPDRPLERVVSELEPRGYTRRKIEPRTMHATRQLGQHLPATAQRRPLSMVAPVPVPIANARNSRMVDCMYLTYRTYVDYR